MKATTVIASTAALSIIIYISFTLTGIDFLKFWPRVIMGLVGFGLMLLMHVYSVRKRNRDWNLFKSIGKPLVSYLNIHIILASFGVAIITFHAFGTYTSAIAWIAYVAMAIVWLSGFIGKYIFVKIPKDHRGLIAQKNVALEQLEDMNQDLLRLMQKNNETPEFKKFIEEYLTQYSKTLHLLHMRDDFRITRFFGNFTEIAKASKLYRKNKRLLHDGTLEGIAKQSEENREAFKLHLKIYEKMMDEVILRRFQMEFYELLNGLFKNWHDIHVPLNYLFYTTAVLHIFVITFFSSFTE